MKMYELLKNNRKNIQKWFLVLAIFYLVSLLIRIPAETGIQASHFGKILLCTGICFSMMLFLWNFSRRVMQLSITIILLYIAIPYLGVFKGLNISAEEIVDAFCLGTEGISCLLLLKYIFYPIKKRAVSMVCAGIIQLMLIFILLVPVVILGYYLLNGQLITGDILLTLFQTNANEALSYIQDRGIVLWGFGIISIILICGIFIKLFNTLSAPPHICFKHNGQLDYSILSSQYDLTDGVQHFHADKFPKIRRPIFLSVVVVLILSFQITVHNAKQFYPYMLLRTTMQTLQSYREYGKNKELRKERLASLPNMHIASHKGGVYVVVIGESETKDHMQVYGYPKETTPWLTSFAKEKGTIVFSHAYSNHTHTVPVLTYALSEKNQYNQINLTNAYSIMETAKAAGYTTYWISNQQKYGAWDTPIAEIASTADHEIWLNENVGEQIKTSVYDEKLADYIPDIQPGSNAFIILHLMGCHGSYQDRYPRAFQTVTGSTPRIDEYDNSVLYNDFVLQCIYNRVKDIPDFKAFIYFSDHGEDVEHNASHESTKFSWTMARIPFLVHVSDSFMQANSETVQTMASHKEAYWTNDLMYDFLIDLLGIEGISHQDTLDIASPAYQQDKTTLTTLHGGKKIAD